MGDPVVTGSYQPWFERDPDLLQWEEAMFEYRGLSWSVDEEAFAQGILIVATETTWKGESLGLRVEYPSEYPELPPDVIGDRVVLERHQGPFSKSFCLFERPEDDWNAAGWGAADLIGEGLEPLLADSEIGDAQVRANEAPMPEPQSSFFAYEPEAVVLMPSDLASPGGQRGKLKLRQFAEDRYYLEEVDGVGSELGLESAFAKKGQLYGTWIRLDKPPIAAGKTGQEILNWLRQEEPEAFTGMPVLKKQLRKSKHLKQPSRQVVGLTFPEEADAAGTCRDGWIFLRIEWSRHGALIRSQVSSPEERSVRVPDLVQLADRKVAVLGVGSLGGDTAVQLARAGIGGLHLFDPDRFEANNSVRHVLDTHSSGLNKAKEVARACKWANPFTQITLDGELRFGGPPIDGVQPLERLYDVVDESSLLVDTTGINQLQFLAAKVAWEMDKPFASCWLTEGSWAGHLVLLMPGRTACPLCFVTRTREGKLLEGDAAEEDVARAFPQGCSHPTTIGAGFEALDLVANTVRLIAGELSAYPSPDWHHAVLNFRRSPDDRYRPRFEVERLEKSENCSSCDRSAG